MAVAEPLFASPWFKGRSLTYRLLQLKSHHSLCRAQTWDSTVRLRPPLCLLWTHFIFMDVANSTLHCYCFLFKQPLKTSKDTF